MASASSVSSTTRAIAGKRILPCQKCLHRDLIGSVQNARSRTAAPSGFIRQSKQRKFIEIRRMEFPVAGLRPVDRGTGAGARSGQVSAYWIGIRISVAETCAITLPSSYSTMACTVDCGCTTTSIVFRREIEQPAGFDHLKSLVHQSRRIDGDAVTHLPCWMLQRVSRRHPLQAPRVAWSETDHPKRSGSALSLRCGVPPAGIGAPRCVRNPPG